LNGVKRFITNGDADISLVLARSEENTTDARGLSLFVYDRSDKAVTVRRIETNWGSRDHLPVNWSLKMRLPNWWRD
jgi:alkylation response protein AidB-like acyl-CoA dehydrogenase